VLSRASTIRSTRRQPPDDALDVFGGARPADLEQPLLGLGCRDPGQRADLRVGQLAMRERLGEPRQRAESPRHAHPFARRAGVEPDAPREPRSARGEAVAPAAAGVELADEIEQARGGGVEVGGELGDLVAEPLELHDVRRGRDDLASAEVHRRVLHGSAPTLHPAFRPSPTPTGRTIRDDPDCFDEPLSARIPASPPAAGAGSAIDC